MKDKDKIFLVAYFGVVGYEKKWINHMMSQFDNYLSKKLDDSINYMIIPDVESKSVRIELLNAKDADEAKLDELKSMYNAFKEEYSKKKE